jgi:hypothetical protein
VQAAVREHVAVIRKGRAAQGESAGSSGVECSGNGSSAR